MSLITEQPSQSISTLAMREQYRDRYWLKRDPIYLDRLLWRAQTFRHMIHLVPSQTILELGAGQGLFSHQLVRVSRGENPITAVTFHSDESRPKNLPHSLEFLNTASLPGVLADRHFDYIVAMDLLDKRNCAWVLQNAYELLKPGGQVIFYESNPWNVILRLRQYVSKYFGAKDPRRLLSRPELYELISEIGFIRLFSVYNDFVYAPLTRRLVWLLRNLSILLENAPRIQTLAGSILIHAQKPPRIVDRPQISLCDHEQLHRAVSVVIPCHNEEMNIGPLITGIKDFFGEYIHEIIPVDDNSRDHTGDVLRRLADEDPIIKPVFRRPPNGVGRAIADGFQATTGRYVLSMDCDFQHLLPEIRDLFDAAAKGYDVVVGSRFSRHSVLLNYPFQKIIANRAFHVLAQIMLHRRFRDLTNNLKLMRREVIETLQLTQPGFAVNAETGLQPLLMGYAVKEVPISWINRTPDMGVSSFNLVKVGGGYWQVLFRLWRKTIFGFRKLPQKKDNKLSIETDWKEQTSRDNAFAKEYKVKRSRIFREKATDQQFVENGERTGAVVRSDRGASVFVWSVWLIMMIVALTCLIKYGRNIPFTEDWLLVSPLTENEPSLINWLWDQNNEHRVPLPRLILLILLKSTNGDFRSGMLFNIIILGALSFAMIRVIRHLRGDRTNFSDAFFPIALLHLGNWENLYWSWQVTQVLPTVLACVILLILVGSPTLSKSSSAVVAGISLILLSLSGANGILFVPFLSIWYCFCGILHLRSEKLNKRYKWIGIFLIGSVLVTICFISLYFVDYERPTWRPPAPGIILSLKGAIQFLALGIGPVARNSWMLSIITVIVILLYSVFLVVFRIIEHKDSERYSALSVLVFFSSIGLYALAIGWGRAPVIPLWGGFWPPRYSLLAVPAICVSFFTWQLYSSKKLRSGAQNILFIIMCLLIPLNTSHGLVWRDWYLQKVESIKEDILKGTPSHIIAARYRDFLFRGMDPSLLAEKIRMLDEADLGLFAQMHEKSARSENTVPDMKLTKKHEDAQIQNRKINTPIVSLEIHYHMSEATKVYLVWGLNGWHVVPKALRPAGTKVENKIKNMVMQTPMVLEGDSFVANVWVPAGNTINYGFRIMERRGIFDIVYPVWDGDYQEIPLKNRMIEITGAPNFYFDLSKMDLGLCLLLGIALIFGMGIIINRFPHRDR